MSNKLVLTREVTPKECFWLSHAYSKGEEVFEYTSRTYGCISPNGIACSEKDDETPFFELPKDSIKIVK